MGINKEMNDLLIALNMESKNKIYQVVITTSCHRTKNYVKKQFEVQKAKKVMRVQEDGKRKSTWVKEQGWYTKDILTTVLCLNEQLKAVREENR